MLKTIASLVAFVAYAQAGHAADISAPAPVYAVPSQRPALSRIVGYVVYTDCDPIADSPQVFVNTEVSSDERPFYVSNGLCNELAGIRTCNGRKFGIVADVATTSDSLDLFHKKTIVGILQLGDVTTNPACIPAMAVPPRHHRRGY
jgi:hypothetical protein